MDTVPNLYFADEEEAIQLHWSNSGARAATRKTYPVHHRPKLDKIPDGTSFGSLNATELRKLNNK